MQRKVSRLCFSVSGMFLKLTSFREAMSGRAQREGQKPYCIWPLPGVQLVEAQREKMASAKIEKHNSWCPLRLFFGSHRFRATTNWRKAWERLGCIFFLDKSLLRITLRITPQTATHFPPPCFFLSPPLKVLQDKLTWKIVATKLESKSKHNDQTSTVLPDLYFRFQASCTRRHPTHRR